MLDAYSYIMNATTNTKAFNKSNVTPVLRDASQLYGLNERARIANEKAEALSQLGGFEKFKKEDDKKRTNTQNTPSNRKRTKNITVKYGKDKDTERELTIEPGKTYYAANTKVTEDGSLARPNGFV